MDRDSAKDVDPTDREHREIGEGLLTDRIEWSSAVAHLYRGEIHRMRLWRERLDQTTSWAIVVMSAILTWTFSSTANPHYVLLLGAVALAAFLIIEARRFRGYDIWRSRVRTLQMNVFAYGLDPSAGLEDPGWRRKLGRSYRAPTSEVGAEEAVAHRLRRVYLLLFTTLLGAWVLRVSIFANRRWPASAAVGWIPGLVVTAVTATVYLALLVIALRPRSWSVDEEIRSESDRR